MPTHQSLAEITLHWCAQEVAPGTTPRLSQKQREALAKTSGEAAKASGVALLQAAAAELSAGDNAVLGLVAAVIEDEEELTVLENWIISQPPPAASPRARAEFVGHHFAQWMMERVGSELPDKMRIWLQQGWPDLRARGGVMTFYRAFCGALQRGLRQNQTAWDDLLKESGVAAATWRQWLIREADAGAQAASHSSGRRAAKVFAVIAMIAAMAGAGAWYWWNEIDVRVRKLRAQEESESSHSAPTPNPPSPDSNGVLQPLPSPIPEPKTGQQVPPAVEEPAIPEATPSSPQSPPVAAETPVAPGPAKPPETSESLPRVNLRPNPLTEAARLMTEAESTLASDNHEAGDRSARSAQDILSVRLPSNDSQLAEGFVRIAQYWERRNDWAEAARVYQRAVKAYEKTPAENTNPQLQAVSRWASALRHNGRNTEAERLYRMLLQAYDGMGTELQPEMASVAHNLGNVLFATGRLRDARDAYNLALKLMADRQSDASAEPMLAQFKASYAQCLKKLGVSEPQIEADIRRILGGKASGQKPGNR